jgi:hypothetical protein
MQYEAFWMPESSASADLAVGERWLRSAQYPGERVIVLNSLRSAKDIPALAEILDKYTVVSPRAEKRPIGGGHAVLAPWAVDEAIVLAEDLASPGGGLLVIDSDPPAESVQAWIARTKATRLT